MPPETAAVAVPVLEPQEAPVVVTETLIAVGWVIDSLAVPEMCIRDSYR